MSVIRIVKTGFRTKQVIFPSVYDYKKDMKRMLLTTGSGEQARRTGKRKIWEQNKELEMKLQARLGFKLCFGGHTRVNFYFGSA